MESIRQTATGFARWLYHAAPLSDHRRYAMKSFAFRRFPALFHRLPAYRIWALMDPTARGSGAFSPFRRQAGLAGAAAVSVIVRDHAACREQVEAAAARFGAELLTVEGDAANLVAAWNDAAHAAAGAVLVFVDDVQTFGENCLEEAVAALYGVPDAALAGACVLDARGVVAAAGWRWAHDVALMPAAEALAADAPDASFLRETEVLAGPVTAVSQSFFRQAGGFDAALAPAAAIGDLSCRARAAGLAVLCQPLASVTAPPPEPRALATTLAAWAPAPTDPPRPAPLQALVLDHYTPTPDRDAGSITITNVMRLLQRLGYQVTFVAEETMLFAADYSRALQRLGVRVLHAPHVRSVAEHCEAEGTRYDVVLGFRYTVVARHLRTLRRACPRARVLLHTADLHFVRLEREAELAGTPKAAPLAATAEAGTRAAAVRAAELAAIAESDCAIVHSTYEREVLEAALPQARVELFGMLMEPEAASHAPFDARRDVAFIGGYRHPPNVDAVLHFHADVLPLLRERVPGVRFVVIGADPPPEITALAGPDVVVTGHVERVEDVLETIRLTVAPLRYGAGVKGKIGTSLAVGVPCVASPIAAEGMGMIAGEEIVVAGDPEAMADAIAALYTDAARWQRISASGLEAIRRLHSVEAGAATLARIFDRAGVRRAPALRALRTAPWSLQARMAAPLPDRAVALPEARSEHRERATFDALLRSPEVRMRVPLEARLAAAYRHEEVFSLPGWCAVCNRETELLVDRVAAEVRGDGDWTPNWRERLVCVHCKLNSRLRFMAVLVREALAGAPASTLPCYVTEQVTAFYRWLLDDAAPGVEWIGSEYLGAEVAPGTVRKGVRHEDLERLSLGDGAVRLIVTNEVLEHVARPRAALAEMARVTAPGGVLLMSIPFFPGLDHHLVRARLEGGRLVHDHPAVYHGNPLSDAGSLVFTDFGWQMLDDLRAAGYRDAALIAYWSLGRGYLGSMQFMFRAVR